MTRVKGQNLVRTARNFLFNPVYSPIIHIGGTKAHQPPQPLLSLVYVDGSYRQNPPRAAVAYYMKSVSGSIYSSSIPIKAQSSTEAEWASIYFGLKTALENDYKDIHIKNDCLSVIQAFLPHSNEPRLDYARYFKKEIKGLATNGGDWVGISWIPRELNLADQILQ